MCQFFSAISNGKGRTLFFKPSDIVKVMAKGNPKSYEWNSHTSISHYFKIKSEDEGKWNFWEYDCEKEVLKLDVKNNDDDSAKVKKAIEKFLKTQNLLILKNLYNWNSGYSNSGNRNSGDSNSGNRNSGDRNSGNSNSDNWNSGDSNSGNWNSGDGNSGSRNSGNWNSGNWNSGDGNSGNWNSGDGIINNFCTKRQFILFGKFCTEAEMDKCNEIMYPIWNKFLLNEWINESEMTSEEKEKYPYYKTTGGYLKKYEYKEMFKIAYDQALANDKELPNKIKSIANFDKKMFFEISGLNL